MYILGLFYRWQDISSLAIGNNNKENILLKNFFIKIEKYLKIKYYSIFICFSCPYSGTGRLFLLSRVPRVPGIQREVPAGRMREVPLGRKRKVPAGRKLKVPSGRKREVPAGRKREVYHQVGREKQQQVGREKYTTR